MLFLLNLAPQTLQVSHKTRSNESRGYVTKKE